MVKLQTERNEHTSKAVANQSSGKNRASLVFAGNTYHVQPKLAFNQSKDVHRKEENHIAGPAAGMHSSVVQTKPFPISTLQKSSSNSDDIQDIAIQGFSGNSVSFPHLGPIQKSFGTYNDVSGAQAYVGGEAADACNYLGASAYTNDNNVAFKSPPDIHTAAHEATHVIQQKKGISTEDGIGRPGDAYERQADAVADRVVGGQSASELLSVPVGDGGSASSLVQLEPATAPVLTDKAPAIAPPTPTATATVPGPVSNPASITTPAPIGQKTVPILLSAQYEDVPGAAKDKDKRATAGMALWMEMSMLSDFPEGKMSKRSVGIVTGSGRQTVDTYPAPVTEGDLPVGQGSIGAELKYADSVEKSLNISVSGIPKGTARKDVKAAETQVREFVRTTIGTFGDVDEIAAMATADIQNTYPEAKVSMSVNDKAKILDAGKSNFFYKVHNAAGILMNVQIVPVGQKNTTYSGTKTTDKGSQDSTAKSDKTTTEVLDIAANERIDRTIDDYVQKMTEAHTEVASDLAIQAYDEKNTHLDDKELTSRKAKNISNYTNDTKQTVESGERDKSNLASKLQKGVQVIKKFTDLSFLPGKLGGIARKLNEWSIGIDLIDKGLGLFAETGKVKFTDTKTDGNVKRTDDITDTTDRNRHADIKETDRGAVTRQLAEDYMTRTKDVWQRHMTDITETSKTYKSTYKKDETQTDTSQQKHDNQTTTATFTVSDTWKFTKPVIQATVVSGDGEVSNVPFAP